MAPRTRSGNSETVPPTEMQIDFRDSMSAAATDDLLKQMAHKYTVFFRTGASRDVRQAQLRKKFIDMRCTLPAASQDALGAAANAAAASDASTKASVTPVPAAGPINDTQQQPAAQQRHLLMSDTGPASTLHSAACSSEETPVCSRSETAQVVSVAEVEALLQQLASAREDSGRLKAELAASQDVCDSLRTELALRAVGTDAVVHVVIQVTEAPPSPSNTDTTQSVSHAPTVQVPVRGSAASSPAAAAAAAAAVQPQPAPKAASTVMLSPPSPAPQQRQQPQQQQQTPLRKQQRQAPSPSTTQPSGSDWVFANLDFAAASSPETAHAAVTKFAATQLGMTDAAQQLSIKRVSQQRAGLAVVRLAGSHSERALRGAKTKLPSSCKVSIFRSLPPEQRHTAAMQRQSQRQPGFISTQEAAAARNAARNAVAFACTRLATARSPGGNRTLSPVAPDFCSPNSYAVLDVDPVPAETPAPAAANPAAVDVRRQDD